MRTLNRSSRPTSEIRAILRRELARSRAGSVFLFDRMDPDDERQGHVRYEDRRVRIWLGLDRHYPFSSSYRGPRGGAAAGFPEYVVTDWREELIATAAHEGYHLRHEDRGAPDDELAAERFALARVRTHRARRPRSWIRRILELVESPLAGGMRPRPRVLTRARGRFSCVRSRRHPNEALR